MTMLREGSPARLAMWPHGIPVLSATAHGQPLAPFAAAAREYIDEGLRTFGAVLFRGFDAAAPDAFTAITQVISRPVAANDHDDNTLTGPTPLLRRLPFAFHNRRSDLASWPMKLFFACLAAPIGGTKMALADCRLLYSALDPGLLGRFASVGVQYIRSFSPIGEGSWAAFFGTSDRTEVARRCLQAGMSHEWLPGDRLRTVRLALPLQRHPSTGQIVFFNQILLHHSAASRRWSRESVDRVSESEDAVRSASFGDGSRIGDDIVSHLIDAYDSVSVPVVMERNDVLVLDNMLTAFRQPSGSGDREILFAASEIHRHG